MFTKTDAYSKYCTKMSLQSWQSFLVEYKLRSANHIIFYLHNFNSHAVGEAMNWVWCVNSENQSFFTPPFIFLALFSPNKNSVPSASPLLMTGCSSQTVTRGTDGWWVFICFLPRNLLKMRNAPNTQFKFKWFHHFREWGEGNKFAYDIFLVHFFKMNWHFPVAELGKKT